MPSRRKLDWNKINANPFLLTTSGRASYFAVAAKDLYLVMPIRECGDDLTPIESWSDRSQNCLHDVCIVGKTKIRDGGIQFEVPQDRELPQRLDAVLEAIYAAFGIG